ncbi:MAG: hypothetical protein K2Q45_09095 [Nitrosomonas sp.]|nr:hypothetical protein [Nitrosomonas sp.]
MEQEGGRSFALKTEGVTSAKATQKRIEDNVSIRKQKRKEKLKDRRTVHVKVTNTAPVQVMVQKQYNRQLLLQRNADQLHLLSQILNQIDEPTLETYFNFLFGTDGAVFSLLMEALPVEHLFEDTLHILVNFTGKLARNQDLLLHIALYVIEYGNFFTIAATIFKTKTHLPPSLRTILWKIIGNLSVCCEEGVEILFNSLLFAGGPSSLFMQTLLTKTTDTDLLECLANILRFLCERSYHFRGQGLQRLVLPDAFLFACYNPLCFAMMQTLEHSMGNYDNFDEHEKELVPVSLICLYLIYELSSVEMNVHLVTKVSTTWTMLAAFNTYIFTIKNQFIQCHMIKLYNTICAVNVGEHFIPNKLMEINSIVMFKRACHSNLVRLREHGFFCMGNFIAESTECCRKMLVQPYIIMEDIIPGLRDAEQKVRKGALYCLMSMFRIADLERKNRMNLRVQAEGLMKVLVMEFHIFKYITAYLFKEQDAKVIYDVLFIIKSALNWNKEIVLKAMDEADGIDTVSRLSNDLMKYKTGVKSELSDLASELDDLLSDGGGGNNREEFSVNMDIDTSGGGNALYSF